MRAIIKVYLCLIYSQNNTLQTLRLQNNQIGDAGAASIGVALAYVTLPSYEWTFIHKSFLWRHPVFFFGGVIVFDWPWGIIKVCMCLICSVNKTLQGLELEHNKIGDAGAASIGVALTYVTLCTLWTNFDSWWHVFDATRCFWIDNGALSRCVFVSDLQPKQHVADVAASK